MSKKDRIYYNKLVRDNIQSIITNKGSECGVRSILDDSEFEQELLKKVQEEAKGLAKSRSREALLGEYADLMVVLDTLTQFHHISPEELDAAIEKNIADKGGYANRHFLEWSDDTEYRGNDD